MQQLDTQGPPRRLRLARALVRALEEGNERGAIELLAKLTAERESEVFAHVGRLTRALHDALVNLQPDAKLNALATRVIPDARERLRLVLDQTEDGARRTGAVLESLTGLPGRIEQSVDDITALWQRLTGCETGVSRCDERTARVSASLDRIRVDARSLRAGLAEVWPARDFQDATNQAIGKIMDLVQEVEVSLVALVDGTRSSPATPERPVEPASQPAVGAARDRVAAGNVRDDLDERLAGLAF
ncbi:MAG: protein phosphatase CheZ [Gammaproteobacteria bacterium]|nr:protein phosphatase CheZ [Gammaproteobacteria bacterium]